MDKKIHRVLKGYRTRYRWLGRRIKRLEQAIPNAHGMVERQLKFQLKTAKEERKELEGKIRWANHLIEKMAWEAHLDEDNNLRVRPFAAALKGFKVR